MVRDDERKARATEEPVIGSLPEVPGILAAISLTPGLALHLRGLVDQLLVNDFPGATLTRGERELLATAVSAANDCFYCMDSHGAFASELLRRACVDGVDALVDGVTSGGSGGVGPKMQALLAVARTVQSNPRKLTRDAVVRALDAGASDADTQLAVLIASAFACTTEWSTGCARHTPPREDAFRARAVEIADHGYSDPRVRAVPR